MGQGAADDGAVAPDGWLGRRADVELALEAAVAAGAAVMESFGRPMEVVEKAPDQPVTPADLEADGILRARLLGARPGYGWLSEETADRPDRLGAERVWIVDPIDGTRSFIAGRPEFAISIGLAERGEAVLGVVHNPATGELFWAVRGGGAYGARVGRGEGEAKGEGRRAGKGGAEGAGAARGVGPVGWAARVVGEGAAVRLRVSEGRSEDQRVLLASRSEIAAGEFDPFHGGWRIRPVGSTAYKLARLAAGDGDVFLSRGPKAEWDVCAGALLVAEAGGRATDLRGEELRYNRPDPRVYGILATNGRLHAYVLGVVETLPPPSRLRENRDPLHPGFEEGE
jgi:myo-inositol-1(or 4)-monophosphatase